MRAMVSFKSTYHEKRWTLESINVEEKSRLETLENKRRWISDRFVIDRKEK